MRPRARRSTPRFKPFDLGISWRSWRLPKAVSREWTCIPLRSLRLCGEISRFAPAAPLAHAVFRAVVLGQDLARLHVEMRIERRQLLRLRRLRARWPGRFFCWAPAHDRNCTPGACRFARSYRSPITVHRSPVCQPQAPIAPQAVQNSQPSLWITAALPHSAQRLPGSTR